MSRLLILGHSPLPWEPSAIQCSGNLRTWHLVKPLLDAGHEVRLVAAQVPDSCPAEAERETEMRRDRLHYFSVAMDLFHDRGYLQGHHDAFDPDAIIGINNYPTSRTVNIETDRPVWCDLNGWAMAEAQTKAATYNDDAYLSHFWRMEASVLDRADVISTVSRAQAHATVGELAQRGRLSRRNVGYEFCHPIPNALSDNTYEHVPGVIRGSRVADDDFVLLWVGGYNTWTDVDLLFGALDRAMSQLNTLHFVSTGGALKGHDDLTFEKFRRRIQAASFRDRVHFAGWVPTSHVPSYYFESDLGINVDRRSYETQFGARNRLNDMLKAGLPILTTLGTEISYDLAQRDLALTAPMGDVESFAERILWAHDHREALRSMADAASTFAHRAYSYAHTVGPLLQWAEAPRRAPDRGEAVSFDGTIDFFREKSEDDASEPEATPAYRDLDQRRRHLEEQLQAVTTSRVWRWYMAYIRARRWLLRRLAFTSLT